ncbi:MAG: hypothetical protein RLY66_371 [Candidatus Parcubacteria bacterium]|jgi:hypothetical protein
MDYMKIILVAAVIGALIVIARVVLVAHNLEKARRLLPTLLNGKAVEGEDLRRMLKTFGAPLSRRLFYRFMAQQHIWVKADESPAKINGVRKITFRRTCEPPALPPSHMQFDKGK